MAFSLNIFLWTDLEDRAPSRVRATKTIADDQTNVTTMQQNPG